MPAVSVIIPAFNAATHIAETLESILPQLDEGDEIIIVDDGSTDATADVIRHFPSPAIHYQYQSNAGKPSVPRNKGIEMAKGELILLFDADDVMASGKLEATKQAYRQFPDSGLICSNFSSMDNSGNRDTSSHLASYSFYKDSIRAGDPGPYQFSSSEAHKALAQDNFVGTSSAAIPKLVVADMGGFREDLANADDREMWLRITSRYPLTFINKPLHYYRCGTIGSITSRRISQRAAGKIEALLVSFRSTKDQHVRLLLRRNISNVYYAQAYDHFSYGEMSAARTALIDAWPRFVSSKQVKLFLKTLLGRRLVNFSRTVKAQLK